jgi:anti-sigma factor RsiW
MGGEQLAAMIEHVTSEDVEQLRHGALSPAEAAAFGAHVRSCAACAALLEPQLAVASAGIRGEVPGAEAHLDPDAQLFPYLEGRLDAAERELVEAHLQSCAECRGDVADLRAIDAQPRRVAGRRRAVWLAAAAAVVVAVFVAPALWRSEPDVPPPLVTQTATTTQVVPPSVRVNPIVRAALQRGVLTMPAVLRQLQAEGSVQRGPSDEPRSSMVPSGEVVDTTRPRFTWSPVPDGVYEVSVFDGAKRVASSGPLREPRWSPERDLPRGRTYGWQVEVQHGDRPMTLPAPTEPPALFHVLEARQSEAIAQARREASPDHLLVGVLYANAGMRAAAEDELAAAAAAHQEGAEALLRSVRSWPAQSGAPTRMNGAQK